MGMQQLLLITVGIIVVVLTIYAGIGMVSNYYQTANRDQLISTLQNLGVMAQQYFKKPSAQGGGGSYTRWTLPKQFSKMDSGTIRATVSSGRINFVATGTEKGINNRTTVRITCRVDQSGIRMTVTN